MVLLDSIESLYLRKPARVKLYDNSIINASVYTMPANKNDIVGINRPPTERYIDIMTRGALHFGVKQSYIDWLNSIEVQPRTKP